MFFRFLGKRVDFQPVLPNFQVRTVGLLNIQLGISSVCEAVIFPKTPVLCCKKAFNIGARWIIWQREG